MGYDVVITRAPWTIRSEHYPIAPAEWAALAARRDDVELIAYGSGGHIQDPADDSRCVWLVPGGGRYKSLQPDHLRYMISIAADLDAWVLGQDGEVYRVDPDGEVRHAYTPPTRPWFRITRRRALPVDEWSALVATQADFRLFTEIEAHCPSGLRSIPCPPTPHWIGSPSGRPVPFILQSDDVWFPAEHRRADGDESPRTVTEDGAATLARAADLAIPLGAEIDD